MMTTLEIWLTALALAMDSFTVSITAGLILKRVRLSHFLTIPFIVFEDFLFFSRTFLQEGSRALQETSMH